VANALERSAPGKIERKKRNGRKKLASKLHSQWHFIFPLRRFPMKNNNN